MSSMAQIRREARTIEEARERIQALEAELRDTNTTLDQRIRERDTARRDLADLQVLVTAACKMLKGAP